MMIPDKIIQTLLEEFKNLEDTDTSGWNRTQWTSAVLTSLCSLGRQNKYYVYASSNFVDEQDKDGGEWLYDVTWCKYERKYEKYFLTSVPLVAECEWDNLGDIKDDFEKLILARAAVRVFVFDGRYCKNGADALANKFCDWVSAFEGSRKGDMYLLVAYEEVKTPWNFRYFKILVNNSGQQPTLIRL